MKNKLVLSTCAFVIIIFTVILYNNLVIESPVKTVSVIKVPRDYRTIQEAIDASSPGDIILVSSGIYYENIVIHKENLTIKGENPKTTIINSRGMGEVIYIVASNIYIEGFTIQNGYNGIYLDHTNNVSIINNIISDNFEYGIYLDSSVNCLFKENIIHNNWCGILTWYSSNNTIYHNNLVNNTLQVDSVTSVNKWDGGYPSGGNYWSNNTGVDFFRGSHQNETGSDGICDAPYIIDSENRDKYPLMKPYAQHDVGITNVVLSKSFILRGENLYINVTTLNYGIYTEIFNITAYANEIEIQTKTVIQPTRTSCTTTFVWETSNINKGIYTIIVYATPVQGETDTTDNTFIDGIVFIDTVTIGEGCSSKPYCLLK